jgi:hypothetical protein
MKPALLAVLLVLTIVPFAAAKNSPEFTQIGRDIRIGPDDEAGDITCIACSIYISGQVAGDVTAIGGNVLIDNQGSVAGDLTTVLGSVRLNDAAKIAGDLAVVGGTLRRAPQVQVSGDVTALEGRAWIWLMLAGPLLILAGTIWLIIWLLDRRRRPAPAQVARAA